MDKKTFVNIKDIVQNCIVDLRYASTNNFTGKVIYNFRDVYLRLGTAEKLQAVQKELDANGYRLVIFDGYRPVAAQFTLWETVPDPIFVADPYAGFSNHSRGNTVDVTLLGKDDTFLEMPTAYDAITPLASRAYEGITALAKQNALFLQNLMYAHGFTGYFHEWWHYEDEEEYPVEHNFLPPV